MANSFQFEASGPNGTRSPHCIACEELLTDALDGALGEIDQTWFDGHVKTCAACGRMFADAQRGAAWLEMLKTPRPEPSSALLERILAQTEGAVATGSVQSSAAAVPVLAAPARILPFRPRAPRVLVSWARLPFEPRLAMTAAMALFSLALTMNLTGIQLGQLRPSSLRRTYYESTAGAARYYDNLRVVRVLESRVDDLREENSERSIPAAAPDSRPSRSEPKAKPEQAQPDSGVSWRATPADRPKTLQAGIQSPSAKDAGGLV